MIFHSWKERRYPRNSRLPIFCSNHNSDLVTVVMPPILQAIQKVNAELTFERPPALHANQGLTFGQPTAERFPGISIDYDRLPAPVITCQHTLLIPLHLASEIDTDAHG
jgi:hypothetical protein